MRKNVDECLHKQNDHQKILLTHSQEIESINSSILRMLKNINTENQVLDREIERMHKIDRIKTTNARNSLLMSGDVGKMLPSLDMFSASVGQSVSIPHDTQDRDNHQTPMMTQRNVVTANELNGICERHNGNGRGGIFSGAPSQRQRILIARSQEQNHRKRISSQNQDRNNQLFNVKNILRSTKGGQSTMQDSIMSATTPQEPSKFLDKTQDSILNSSDIVYNQLS